MSDRLTAVELNLDPVASEIDGLRDALIAEINRVCASKETLAQRVGKHHNQLGVLCVGIGRD